MPFGNNSAPVQQQTAATQNTAAQDLDRQVYNLVEQFRADHPEFVVWYDLKVKPAPAKIATYASKHHTVPLANRQQP